MTTQRDDNQKKNKNSKLNYFVDRKGFTISELIIVITVMAFLTVIGGRVYYTERNRFEFNNAFIEMLGIIKTARNYATTSQAYYVDDNIKNVIPIDGYGVRIKLNAATDELDFTLFANLGSGNYYEDYQNDDYPDRFDNNDQTIKTYHLPKQVIFRSFYFNGNEQWNGEEEIPSATEAVIIFKPPMAEAFLGNNAGGSLEELRIKFINPDAPEVSPKKCLFIRINRIKTFPELRYSGYDVNGECEEIDN